MPGVTRMGRQYQSCIACISHTDADQPIRGQHSISSGGQRTDSPIDCR